MSIKDAKGQGLEVGDLVIVKETPIKWSPLI
jgi:uncharacterized Zn ribbon protein